MIPQAQACPRCAAALPPDAPQALCPRCLFALGLGEADAPGGVTASPVCPDPAPTAGPEETDPLRELGDYELLEEIGRGGMGIVYRARQRSLNRIVALKLLPWGAHAPAEAVQRLRAEAIATAALQHPHIVAVHEVGVCQGRHFIAMDFVPGQPLSALIRGKPLPSSRAARYAQTIAEAIDHAHGHGILHRDLKPSNILIDAEDQPRVMDFGLARRLEGDSELTATGQVLGSPNYMPPEQAAGKRTPLSPRTDVYALGAILYHLLTGRPPFAGESVAETVHQVLSLDPVPPRLLNHTVPRDLETVCLKCLEKEPARRYGTARAVAEELGRFLEGRPVLGRAVGRSARLWRWCRRNPTPAGLIAALLVAILAGFTGVLGQLHRAELAELSARRNAYVADMNLAQHALAQNNLARARRLLERHGPPAGADRRKSEVDLRGWEWRYLWPKCQSDALFSLGSHSNSISALAFAQAGQFLAARDDTGRVKLWDVAGRKEIAGWPEEAHQLRTLAVSPDGNRLALGRYVASSGPAVEIWSVTPRERLLHLPHGAAVVSVAFSPDGHSLATFAFDSAARIWDVDTGKLNARLPASPLSGEHKGVVAFSPDGRTLAVGETDGHVRLITVEDCQERTTFPAHPEGEGISALAFSGNSRLLATASGYSDPTIRLWQVESGQSAGQLSGHAAWVIALAVAPDGQTLASASADQTVRLWNLERQECQATLRGHLGEVWSLAFSPDGQRLASGSQDGSICFWDPQTNTMASAAYLLPVPIRQLVFAPDGQAWDVLNPDGTVSTWEGLTAPTGKVLRALGNQNTSLAMAGDGRLLVAGTATGTLQVYDRARGNLRTAFVAHGDRILYLQFCAHNRSLVSVAADRTLALWDVPVWQERRRCQLDPQPWPFEPEFEASLDGRWAAVSDAYAVEVWNLTTGRRVQHWSGGMGWIDGVAWSPSGGCLAIAGANGVTLFQTANWRVAATLRGHLLSVHSLAFSPDGSRLATGSNLKEAMKLWDLTTLQEVATLEGQGTHFFATRFSPDGSTLAGISYQGTAHFWRAPSLAEIGLRAASDRGP